MSALHGTEEWHFQGAAMHEVNPDTHVGFSYPCIRRYDFGIFHMVRSCTHSDTHGHIVIACDDGTAVIPVPIYSLPFLHIILNHLAAQSRLHTLECEKLIEVATPILKGEMTPYEHDIAQDMSKLKKVTECAFYGI